MRATVMHIPPIPSTPPNGNDRDPRYGLTTRQLAELDEELTLSHSDGLADLDETYRRAAQSFAMRSALLLSGNDLRGAMSAAEICRASLNLADQSLRRLAIHRAVNAERRAAEREDPAGMLVTITGKRRAKRVYPEDPWPADAVSPDPRVEPDPDETRP